MTNNELYIRQKEEAIKRMELLVKKYDLNPNLVKYLKQDKVYYSYLVGGIVGSIDTIKYDESIYNKAVELEERYGAYIYHAIESFTNYGRMISYLYVSKYEDEWCDEHLLDKPYDNYLSAIVYNYDYDFDEVGTIEIASASGAIVRIE